MSELLHEHVEHFNAGVRTGDWAPMVELMTEDADLEFVGIAVGPFHGREAIEQAYPRCRPPDLHVGGQIRAAAATRATTAPPRARGRVPRRRGTGR